MSKDEASGPDQAQNVPSPDADPAAQGLRARQPLPDAGTGCHLVAALGRCRRPHGTEVCQPWNRELSVCRSWVRYLAQTSWKEGRLGCSKSFCWRPKGPSAKITCLWAGQLAQMVMNLPAMQETRVRIPGWGRYFLE